MFSYIGALAVFYSTVLAFCFAAMASSATLVAAAVCVDKLAANVSSPAATQRHWQVPHSVRRLQSSFRALDILPLCKRQSVFNRSKLQEQVRRILRVETAAGLEEIVLGAEVVDGERAVVVIDNYDSFTYNLVQYLGDLGCKIEVFRNDEITVEELRKKNPRGILISPGPGTPQDSGISLQIVRELGPSIPLFGVCMGLQCMGEAFGGNIVRAPNGVMHGKTSSVFYDEKGEPGLLYGLPSPFTACRYHSLVIEKDTFPADELEVTAWTEDGLVMGVRHRIHKHIQGVQFHPESIRTENGMQIVSNFLKMLDRMEGAGEETEAKVFESA